jgi:conjugal transfer pilus assembly protein TraI
MLRMELKPRHPSDLFKEIGRDVFLMIRTECGAGDEGFKRLYLPAAERLALVVQEAPFRRDAYARQGGALAYGLLAAALAVRLSSSTIFRNGLTAKERLELAPQYKWAAFIATLHCVSVVVLHGQKIDVPNSVWTPWDSSQTLFDVAQKPGKYAVSWLPSTEVVGHVPNSLAIVSGFAYPGMFAGLERGVVRDLCAAINPSLQRPPTESPLASVVRRAQELVLAAESKRLAREVTSGNASLSVELVAAVMAEPVVQQPPAAEAKQASLDGAQSILSQQLPLEIQQSASGLPPTPSAEHSAAPSQVRIPANIAVWIKAIASSEAMARHVEILLDGSVTFSKQALAFGMTASKRYEELFKAGLVITKTNEASVICLKDLAALYQNEREAIKAKG